MANTRDHGPARYTVQYFKNESGSWDGSPKDGYTEKQVIEEACALYLWLPDQFPDGIRVVDRHGFIVVAIETTVATVTLMVRQHNEWVPASVDTCHVPIEKTTQEYLGAFIRMYGAANVLPVYDRYPIIRFTPAQLAAAPESARKAISA